MRRSQWSMVDGQWKVHALVRYFLLFVILCILQFRVSAQSVLASLDRDKILLGEQVTLQLTISNVSEASLYIEAWPQIADTLNHIEIIKRNDIDTINVNGINTYQQNFIITSFDSGRWQLGPFNFIATDKTTGKKTQLETAPVYLIVLPVDVSTMDGYHPIKDIIEVQTKFNWRPLIITVLALVAAVLFFLFIKKRNKQPAPIQKPEIKGTPIERALEKLNALQKAPLSSTTDIKKFHFEMDTITRKYLEEATNIKALHLTAAELLPRLKIFIGDAGFRQNFSTIFNLNAAVKFAKYMPPETESRHTLRQVITILLEIDDNIKKTRADAERMVPKY